MKRKHFYYKYCIDLVMLLALKTLHNIQSNGVEESMPFFGGGGDIFDHNYGSFS